MGLDYSFLQGLSGRRDWNGIKAERQNELQYQAALNSAKQAEIDRQAILNNQMQEYYNTANQLQVTPIGRDRINERVNNPMKEAIAEKIKKYGGDLEMYMKVEGATDMNNYIQTLVNSPETKRELTNAANISKWTADKQAGLEERLTFDETTGSFGGSFNEKLSRYLDGESETIDYEGAFKPLNFDETFFSENYGDKDRYKSVPVSAKDYAATAYRHLIEKGLSERDAAQQAHDLAKKYTERVTEKGVPLRWKSDAYPRATGTAASAGEAAKLEDAKYVIEQLGKAMTGSDDVYRKVSGVVGTEKSNKPAEWKRGTVLSGTSLGKFTYPSKDAQDNVQSETSENIVQDWIFMDGKPFIKTTQSAHVASLNNADAGGNKSRKVNGNAVDRFGYMPVTDDVISGIAVAKGIPYHSLRKGLVELGAYGKQTPEVEKSVGGSKYTAAQEAAIAANLAANPDYTREEIISALGY